MRIISLFLLVAFLFCTSLRLAQASTFARVWEREQGFSENSVQVLGERYKDHKIFFVGGLLQEFSNLMQIYFVDQMDEAKALGIETFYHNHFSSFYSIDFNVEHLKDKILESYSTDHKKIILIAHSKGGLEVLYALLKYPELITLNCVEAAIVIQTPIFGTPAAENENMSYTNRFLSAAVSGAMNSLRRDIAKPTFFDFIGNYPRVLSWDANQHLLHDLHENFSKRIFFVRSFKPPQQVSPLLRTIHFLNGGSFDHHGLNDGLILTKHQSTSLFGTTWTVVADHLELVLGGLLVNGTAESRRAFLRAILISLPIFNPLHLMGTL